MDPPLVSLRHRPPCFPEDPLDIPRSSLGVLQTQAPMLSGGSLGILPWCTLRHRPPCCPGDPLDIPGSSLGVLSDTGPHAVQRIPWTSQNPPLVSCQTQALMLSGESLGHPPCCPEDSLDIPGSSLGVPSDQRIPWTSWDPPLVSHQTQAPMLSGGTLGHPGILPWCPLGHPRIPGLPITPVLNS